MPNVFENDEPDTDVNPDIERFKQTFANARRDECRDHHFSDVEIFWNFGDSDGATGYFGGGTAAVYVMNQYGGFVLRDDDAKAVREVGRLGAITRNDTTGPDVYGGP